MRGAGSIAGAARRALAALLIVPLLSASAGCQSAPAAKPENAGTGPTVIHIGSKVIRSGLKRLGMNMSGQSYYDSGQMLRDLTFRNPGFEGEIWQTVLECKFVKGDACADSDEWSWWPEGFAKGGTFEFFWGAAKGQKGVVSASAPAAAAAHQGVWVSFGNLAVHPQVGDYYILRMKHPGNAGAGWNIQTSDGATVDTEFKDLSPNSPGKQALRIEASKPYQKATILTGFDTWDNKSFVQMKGAYTLSFRAKGIAGTRELTASVTRLSSNYGNMTYLTHRVPLTTQWQDYKFTFQAHESGNYVGPVHVQIAVNSASLLLDDLSLTEAPADDNPTAFRNAVVTRLRELKPGILRYMDNGTSFGSTIDNLIAPPFARERSGYSEGNKVQEDIPIGIHEFLVLCKTVGADPWISLPVGLTPAEARNLIQYLSGAAESAYGAKRIKLGQAEPWTKVFGTVHLELGNETWNWGSFPGEGIPEAKAYATRVGDIFGAMRAAPLFESAKFDLVMDGWYAVPWWTERGLTAVNTHADSIDIAPYTFDSYNDASSNEVIFGPMFAEGEFRDSLPNGLVMQNAKLAAKNGMKLDVYEVNLGGLGGKATLKDLDAAFPSVGAGVSVAEHMLLMMRDSNVNVQALFCLPEYANGFDNPDHPGSKDLMKLWGAVVDMGGQTNRVRPTFLAEQLANEAILPKMVETTHTGANPTWDQPATTNAILNDQKIQMKAAHLLQSFAFADGGHASLVLFNLSRDSALPVTLAGTGAPRGVAVKMSRLTSAKITDSNENADTVKIQRETLAGFNASAPYTLPPFSMTVFEWDSPTPPPLARK